ncbi:hypothetical protein Purlil1_12474 [Purpureocillium lilacinum]|uniref:Zn(2)-C6 fungal-type domain-containing protein n=1 Tax=Purpureocillium lilacinum TaxID=33203 RepID=A0ABR0BGX5_PURLI|nr:hypothetical protein Purlil1_12474 [Purpureocillium lilacinum]
MADPSCEVTICAFKSSAFFCLPHGVAPKGRGALGQPKTHPDFAAESTSRKAAIYHRIWVPSIYGNRQKLAVGAMPRISSPPARKSKPVHEQALRNTCPCPSYDPSWKVPQDTTSRPKRGPFTDPHLRKETAQTRKRGSCIRCRMQRIRCSTDADNQAGPCRSCASLLPSESRLPCFKAKITDIRLHGLSDAQWPSWLLDSALLTPTPRHEKTSTHIETIQILYGLCSGTVELRMRKLTMAEHGSLAKNWGVQHSESSVDNTPYVLLDYGTAKKAYTRYIRKNAGIILRRALGGKDRLIYTTYRQAWKVYVNSETPPEALALLGRVFRLWVALRMAAGAEGCAVDMERTRRPGLAGNETSCDRTVTVPFLVKTQLEFLLDEDVIGNLQTEVLKLLQAMMYKGQRSTWLTRYLTVFILLHNYVLLMAHERHSTNGDTRTRSEDGNILSSLRPLDSFADER